MRHIIESQQFDLKTIKKIFTLADSLERKKTSTLQGKILASLFYEPSTRTRFSFESAMLRLGGSVISTENASEFSSAIKGESLEDTIKVINQYADIIILRHTEMGASERAAAVSKIPVINAGDGAGQHPTQALLDLYTIRKELGKIAGTHIAMVGDTKYSRTIRSLTYLLGKYKKITITFVSPKALRVGNDIKEYLKRHHVAYSEIEKLEEVISVVDVVYQTRVQKERFQNQKQYEKLKDSYRIDMNLVSKMKKGAILMDPLPRVNTIAEEVDSSPHAVYFRQAGYGLHIRKALLVALLKK